MQSKPDQPILELNNGLKMPQIGLGTFLSPDADLTPIVKSAILDHGYRHIDTASLYGNEGAIGKALKECFAAGIKREELFITTKLWADQKKDVEGAMKKSLELL